jgi:predicted phosphoribosyltransferase
MNDVIFRDRVDAGQQLADQLAELPRGAEPPVVLALPRGGVPVACEVARRLGAPLDIMVVRKLGVPWEPELAMGAIASGGVRILHDRVLLELRIPDDELERVIAEEHTELVRRERLYRSGRAPVPLRGRAVIIVDDGIATGSTVRAAVAAAQRQGATHVLVAAPVAAPETCHELARDGIETICVARPPFFYAIGQFYVTFPQLTDADVARLLEEFAAQEVTGVAP